MMPDAEAVYYRGVDVKAPPEVVFRWLCQLRAAPYSYDWLDNFGRRSPRTLTPGLENLSVGQRVMTIFELVSFESLRHMTIRIRSRSARELFGDVIVSYVVEPSPGGCRLLAKLAVRYPRNLWGRLMRIVLPPGDLIMMRKQLLTLRELAER